MKILVLGASGITGKAIVEKLAREHEVYGTYFSQNMTYDNYNAMIYLDMGQLKTIQNILDEIEPTIIISSLRGDFKNQMQLHKIVAQYIQSKIDGKLIYLSSANAFDNLTDSPHYESDIPNAISEYGIFKASCENMLNNILQEKVVIIRVPFIWSKKAPRYLQILEDISMNNPIKCYNDLYCNHTSDKHIAHAIDIIINEDLKGIIHIGSNDISEYKEFLTNLLMKLNYYHYSLEQIHTSNKRYYLAVITEHKDIITNMTITSDEIIDYLVHP